MLFLLVDKNKIIRKQEKVLYGNTRTHPYIHTGSEREKERVCVHVGSEIYRCFRMNASSKYLCRSVCCQAGGQGGAHERKAAVCFQSFFISLLQVVSHDCIFYFYREKEEKEEKARQKAEAARKKAEQEAAKLEQSKINPLGKRE